MNDRIELFKIGPLRICCVFTVRTNIRAYTTWATTKMIDSVGPLFLPLLVFVVPFAIATAIYNRLATELPWRIRGDTHRQLFVVGEYFSRTQFDIPERIDYFMRKAVYAAMYCIVFAATTTFMILVCVSVFVFDLLIFTPLAFPIWFMIKVLSSP